MAVVRLREQSVRNGARECRVLLLDLADPTLTVQEVGYLLGFSEPSAFHRAFRRWEARTPSEYRNQICSLPPR